MEYLRKSPLKPEDIGGLFNQESVKDKSSHDLVDIIAKNRELLEEIENLETDQETKKLIIGRVFEHSTSDGLQLAERSNFTNKDYFDVIKNPKFYLKHKALAEQIIQEAKFSAQSQADKEAVAELAAIYKKYDEDLAAGNDQIFLKTEKIQDHKVKTLLNKVDNWYSQFLKTKNIAPASAEIDPRSPGEILGEDALEQIQLALEKNYYPTDVMRLVVKYLAQTQEKSLTKQARDIFRSDKLLQEKYKFKGFDDYLENIKKGKESLRQIALENLRKILNPEEMHKLEFGDYLPEIIIQKIIDKYKIDDDKILKQFTEARYKPLSITFKIQTQEAEKKLIQEINAKGKQIIWDEKLNKFIVEAGDVEQKETKFLTEQKILNELERLLQEGANKNSVAAGLAGLDSPQAWAMRERLLKEGASKDWVARGLAGLDSPQAWAMRERLLKEVADKNSVAAGLAGLDSPQAWAMRERLLKEGANKGSVARGLAGLDSPQAWAMRERLLKEGASKDWVAEGLAGLDSPQAWAMRERLLKEGASKDWVALGLAGLDSPQAWAMRERLLKEGASKDWVAEGLAGLDSPQAWAMRERLLKEGADEGWVALGLAGLDSPQAWAMRERLLKEGADEGWVARGLAGDHITFVWQLENKNKAQDKDIARKLELLNILNNFVPVRTIAEEKIDKTQQEDEKNSIQEKSLEEKEGKFLTEEKILDELERLLQEGVNKNSVAAGLAGLDSPQAWAMRERLLKEGASKGWVALGLAGLDSPQAWAMRERLLKEGADKDWVARGLAGLDSPQAWAMRERLLKEGVDKGSVALGLAGLDSPQAWAMRERLLKEGVDKGSVARGLAGLDSPQAWAMRERLLKEGVYKGSVAEGLAGLDSPQAWAMRERLLKEGASKDSVALGLAGLDSPQAWAMRERLLKEGASKDWVAEGLAGLDSPQAWAMRERLLKEGVYKGSVAEGLAGDHITFVWQLKNKPTEEAVIEQKISRAAAQEFDENKLRIEINNYLSQSSLLAQERNLSLKQKLRKGISQSKSVAKILSEMIKHSPEAFINTMAAKKDKRQTAKKLAGKTFPSILWSRPDNNWRSWGGYAGFDFSSDSRKEEAEPEDYLSPRSLEMMLGGNPEGLSKEGKDKEVMRFREPINGLLVTGIYGRLSGNNWDSSYQFAVDKKVMEKAKETTITLPQVGKKSKLPKLLNTEIIPERVKGIKKGEEIPLAVDISPMREATVNDTKGCRELVYSVESDEVPSVMREISNEEYIRFKEKFIKENGPEAIQPIAELPEEIDLFLQQIKNKSPKEQVQAIEEFVRSISYYDEKNGEMINLKINKSLDERLAIMQARVDELKAKNPKDKEILQNKMYAGVCADFAVLAAAILRRAGFVSGVLAGFYAQGASVKLSNAHGTAFVVWPNQKGGNEIFAVDGTPEGLEGISAPSLVEFEKIREEKIAEIKQEAMEKLDEIMEILASHDEKSIKKLTNGELEKVLNTVLRYDVKQENLQAINTMLEVYWYSPIHKLDLTEVDDKIKILKFFESEINKIRESQAEPVIDPGSKLFETVEAFTQRFSRGEDIQKGLDIIDNIASLVGNRLKQSERKALAVITTYLRAKKIKGDGN